MPFPTQQIVFQEMLDVISEATGRLERYDQEIERAVPGWRWEPAVRALMSLRGMALHHRYTHLTRVGKKKSQVAVTAVARELTGFVWAIARQVEPLATIP
jgi:hypothetical protein